ncbi:hypothetical protein [Rhizobium sp. RAF56]|uniref:hypothetical protein n=1 Tax=Rhizobium sp. RAF56 TaxID=3233062 RepID=UPI003F9CAEC7
MTKRKSTITKKKNGAKAVTAAKAPAIPTRKDRVEMSVQELIEIEFTPQEREEMQEANKRLGRIYRGKHLDDWLKFVPQLARLREAAQHAAKSNRPKGPAYNEFLRGFLRALLPNFLDGEVVREEAGHLAWLGEEAERMAILQEYRATLTASQHAKLASPKGARNAVLRIIAAREAEERAKKLGAKEDNNELGEAIAAQRDEDEPPISEKQFLAAFDKRPVGQMAVVLLGHSLDRAKDLADAIIAELRAARRDAKEAERLAKARAAE